MDAGVAKVAAGLTKAQREFLSLLPTFAVATYPPAKWLCFKDLAEWNGHRFVATPLGLAVRNHLLKEPNDGR